MKKISDYIVEYLENIGTDTVFLVTGGGAMHLNDSFGKSQKIRKIFNHHEQGSAIAAEGYARIKQKMAVVNVTTGPGGLNTLTGVFGQWTDSVPVVYISGQVRYDTTVESQKGRLEIRQMGDQEVDIISVVRPLTKFAVTIKDAMDTRWILEKAIFEANNGRPGPVWIDVPHNIQSSIVDETEMIGFQSPDTSVLGNAEPQVRELIAMLKSSKRPVIVAGQGTRISGIISSVGSFCVKYGIPVLTTFNNYDAFPDSFSNYSGRIGTIGQRAGNLCLQNADFVLFLGTRNNIRQVSYSWKFFCRAAKRVIIEIDRNEIRKPFVQYDLAICADLREVWPLVLACAESSDLLKWNAWLEWCKERQQRFPTVTEEQRTSKCLNPYFFCQELTKKLPAGSIVIAGNGTSSVCLFQSAIVKEGQRMVNNSGCAAMGYDVPAALGAAAASGNEVICLAGDGSFQMNIQELATIFYNHLPVKIFYLDNGGYASIRQTQDNFFGRRYGIDEKTGIAFPNTKKLAEAYHLEFSEIIDKDSLHKTIDTVLSANGPTLCHVHLDPDHIFEPKLSSERKPDGTLVSKPLEDMYPFLSREELKKNMIIDLMPED